MIINDWVGEWERGIEQGTSVRVWSKAAVLVGWQTLKRFTRSKSLFLGLVLDCSWTP